MDAVDGFTLRVGNESDGTVVRLSGELDIASAPLLDECLQSLDGQAVTIDFAKLTFIDSSGLNVLVTETPERTGRPRWCCAEFSRRR